MKKYPSIWITKVSENNWNISHSVEEAVYLSTKIVILLPKPCRIYKTMDIRFDGEPPRDKWIFGTNQFIEYSKELTEYLEEVCSV